MDRVERREVFFFFFFFPFLPLHPFPLFSLHSPSLTSINLKRIDEKQAPAQQVLECVAVDVELLRRKLLRERLDQRLLLLLQVPQLAHGRRHRRLVDARRALQRPHHAAHALNLSRQRVSLLVKIRLFRHCTQSRKISTND
jgi:hypothetical protein